MRKIFYGLSLFCLVSQATHAESTLDARDYQVGPGDLLTVSVLGVDSFNSVSRVSNSGRIHLPHLGVLSVSGRTRRDIEELVENRLRQSALLKEPEVSISIEEFRAHPVYVLGEVMTPGQFVITEEMYLADLIALANGFNEVASPTGYLYRRSIKSPAGAEAESELGETVGTVVDEAIPIVFEDLYSDPDLNLRLQGGDVLYVPERVRKYVYVVGDVGAPGRFEIPPDEDLSVLRALGMASGPLRTAKLSKALLVSRFGDGSLNQRPMDLSRILKNEGTDVTVADGDILFIPGSGAKTFGYGLLNAIPMTFLWF